MLGFVLSTFLLAWPTLVVGGAGENGYGCDCDYDCDYDYDYDYDYDADADADADPVASADSGIGGGGKEPERAGADNPALVAVLEKAEIRGEIKKLTGGNMIKYVFRLEDGSRDGLKVVLKPEQAGDWGDWRYEVAAWHLDQALGYGLVPATAIRELPMSLFDLSDPKIAELLRPGQKEAPRPDERLCGAVQVWVAESRVADEGEGRAWADAMLTELGSPGTAIKDPAVASFFVRMVIFDFLLSDPDRYSGGNLLKDSTGRFWAIDNAGAFVGCVRPRTDLNKLKRFEKEAVQRLRKLNRKELRTKLAGLVSERQLRQLWKRRGEALDRVHELGDKLGKKRVLF